MRLICPNCDAQYEVDDTVIPEGGRDVQCSNCGQTWFQPAAGEPPAQAEAEAQIAPTSGPQPDADAATTPAEEPGTASTAEPEPENETPDVKTAQPQRRALDDSVLDVLREEADREAQARRNEGGKEPLESQPGLGLEEAGSGAQGGLRARMARLRGTPADASADVATTGTRRELLPDIEEINSTLRSRSDRQAGKSGAAAQVLENDPLPRKRGRFGLGFGVIILIGALAAAIYLLAPKIAMLLPASAPLMSVYVDTVNELRVSLNGTITSLAEKATTFVNGLTR